MTNFRLLETHLVDTHMDNMKIVEADRQTCHPTQPNPLLDNTQPFSSTQEMEVSDSFIKNKEVEHDNCFSSSIVSSSPSLIPIDNLSNVKPSYILDATEIQEGQDHKIKCESTDLDTDMLIVSEENIEPMVNCLISQPSSMDCDQNTCEINQTSCNGESVTTCIPTFSETDGDSMELSESTLLEVHDINGGGVNLDSTNLTHAVVDEGSEKVALNLKPLKNEEGTELINEASMADSETVLEDNLQATVNNKVKSENDNAASSINCTNFNKTTDIILSTEKWPLPLFSHSVRNRLSKFWTKSIYGDEATSHSPCIVGPGSADLFSFVENSTEEEYRVYDQESEQALKKHAAYHTQPSLHSNVQSHASNTRLLEKTSEKLNTEKHQSSNSNFYLSLKFPLPEEPFFSSKLVGIPGNSLKCYSVQTGFDIDSCESKIQSQVVQILRGQQNYVSLDVIKGSTQTARCICTFQCEKEECRKVEQRCLAPGTIIGLPIGGCIRLLSEIDWNKKEIQRCCPLIQNCNNNLLCAKRQPTQIHGKDAKQIFSSLSKIYNQIGWKCSNILEVEKEKIKLEKTEESNTDIAKKENKTDVRLHANHLPEAEKSNEENLKGDCNYEFIMDGSSDILSNSLCRIRDGSGTKEGNVSECLVFVYGLPMLFLYSTCTIQEGEEFIWTNKYGWIVNADPKFGLVLLQNLVQKETHLTQQLDVLQEQLEKLRDHDASVSKGIASPHGSISEPAPDKYNSELIQELEKKIEMNKRLRQKLVEAFFKSDTKLDYRLEIKICLAQLERDVLILPFLHQIVKAGIEEMLASDSSKGVAELRTFLGLSTDSTSDVLEIADRSLLRLRMLVSILGRYWKLMFEEFLPTSMKKIIAPFSTLIYSNYKKVEAQQVCNREGYEELLYAVQAMWHRIPTHLHRVRSLRNKEKDLNASTDNGKDGSNATSDVSNQSFLSTSNVEFALGYKFPVSTALSSLQQEMGSNTGSNARDNDTTSSNRKSTPNLNLPPLTCKQLMHALEPLSSRRTSPLFHLYVQAPSDSGRELVVMQHGRTWLTDYDSHTVQLSSNTYALSFFTRRETKHLLRSIDLGDKWTIDLLMTLPYNPVMQGHLLRKTYIVHRVVLSCLYLGRQSQDQDFALLCFRETYIGKSLISIDIGCGLGKFFVSAATITIEGENALPLSEERRKKWLSQCLHRIVIIGSYLPGSNTGPNFTLCYYLNGVFLGCLKEEAFRVRKISSIGCLPESSHIFGIAHASKSYMPASVLIHCLRVFDGIRVPVETNLSSESRLSPHASQFPTSSCDHSSFPILDAPTGSTSSIRDVNTANIVQSHTVGSSRPPTPSNDSLDSTRHPISGVSHRDPAPFQWPVANSTKSSQDRYSKSKTSEIPPVRYTSSDSYYDQMNAKPSDSQQVEASKSMTSMTHRDPYHFQLHQDTTRNLVNPYVEDPYNASNPQSKTPQVLPMHLNMPSNASPYTDPYSHHPHEPAAKQRRVESFIPSGTNASHLLPQNRERPPWWHSTN